MKHTIIYITMLLFFLTSYCSYKTPSKQGSLDTNQINNRDKRMTKEVKRTENEWKKILTPAQYRVMRKGGTEKPFSGEYNDHYEKGMYNCAGCSTPLFSSKTKYNHYTGWPSFTAPVKKNHIIHMEDTSFFMKRTEVKCAVCGSHLGHVFDDGPGPTYKHYCINSIALEFKPGELQSEQSNTKPNSIKNSEEGIKKKIKAEKATFAAGCFWGVEHKFRQIQGVLSTVVGYTGGHVKNPTYKHVCADTTGHAEAVEITFDPSRISYDELLKVFFRIHDPTQLNSQGLDVGTQYRSAIFYHNQEQKETAIKTLNQFQNSGRFTKPIVTEIVPASEFYKAEEYHQQYIKKHTKSNKRGCGADSCGR